MWGDKLVSVKAASQPFESQFEHLFINLNNLTFDRGHFVPSCCLFQEQLQIQNNERQVGSMLYRAAEARVSSQWGGAMVKALQHIALILRLQTGMALFSDFCILSGTVTERTGSLPSLFVSRFHQTDKWSRQSGDRGLNRNDRALNNSVRGKKYPGGGIFVLRLLHLCHQYCYCGSLLFHDSSSEPL